MTPRIVALGLDAADHGLVTRLAADGRMPTLAALMSDGVSGGIRSPAWLGSGAVWPTFVSGVRPEDHGVFSEYSWNPRSMTVGRPNFSGVRPFWKALAERGCNATVVDVPFTPIVGDDRLVEIVDWGAHDWLGGPCVVSPSSIREQLAGALSSHPFVSRPGVGSHIERGDMMRAVLDASLEGTRLRGDLILRLHEVTPDGLLLAVFPETHRASTLCGKRPPWTKSCRRSTSRSPASFRSRTKTRRFSCSRYMAWNPRAECPMCSDASSSGGGTNGAARW